MKNVLTIFIMLLLISCNLVVALASEDSVVPVEPESDIWQYADDKFVSFKEDLNMTWEYDDPSINFFEIDREEKKLEDIDYEKIARFVNEENKIELIEIYNKYGPIEDKDWDNKRIKVIAKDERKFIDKETRRPTFGNIYFYRLFAVVQPDPQKPGIKSEPAVISVIVLEK